MGNMGVLTKLLAEDLNIRPGGSRFKAAGGDNHDILS